MSTSTTTAGNVSPSGRPDEPDRYTKAFLSLRLGVGILGIALPVILLIGDIVVLEGSPTARGSLSAYYHSGMRDVFVGGLMVVGVFLVTYRVTRHHLTNWTTTAAGLACVGVAVFPTRGRPGYTPTPLEEFLDGGSRFMHAGCAVVFILLLAVMSVFFARDARQYEPTARWAAYHYACAGVIVGMCLFIAVTKVSGLFDDYSLLIGETGAVMAFGASWLSKGLELKILLPPWARQRLR